MSKIIACHQPNFLPYLGFFDKMKKCDVFVIRDEVLYVKKEYHNRNRIRINGNNINNPQFKWVNVPVSEINDYIKHIFLKRDFCVKKRLWNEVLLHEIKSAYKSSDYFEEFFPEIERIFDNSDEKLIKLNMKIINFLKDVFNIKTEIIMASELGLKPAHYCEGGDASEDLANICRELNGDVYLSGSGGREYLNLESFEKKGIKVEFQDFKHPVYRQKFPGFVPNMASIDSLFCVGKLPCEHESKFGNKDDRELKQEILTIKT